MKKIKVIFVLALFSGLLISAGGAFASDFTQTNVPVSFWLVDTFDPTGDEVTLAIQNISFDITVYQLQYDDGSGWQDFDTLAKTFTVVDEELFKFQLVDNAGNVIDTGNLDFYLETTTPGLYKNVKVTWNDGNNSPLGSLNFSFVSAGNCDSIKPVPIPPSALLLGSGVIGLIGFGVRRRKASVS